MAMLFEDDSMLIELNESCKELIKDITEQIESLKNAKQKEIRSHIEEIKTNLKQCGITIKEMKMEIKALDKTKNWNVIIDEHQTKYRLLKTQFEKEKNVAQKRDIYYGQDVKHAAMLKQAKNDKNVLMESQKELHETELNAIDCMDVLDEQTAQIKKIKANVKESNSLLDNMGKTIKKMQKRWWA